jgi:catechol 2,3-dioxygenase-like lactoylglutathione lyase family enzyme
MVMPENNLRITRLHHVGILVADIDAAVEVYAGLLQNRPPRIVDVAREAIRLRSAMIPVGHSSGTYIQLIQPQEGPGVDEMAEGGEGVLFEVAFEVEDVEAAVVAARRAGDTPSDLAGIPIEGSYLTASSGNRYFYLQPTHSRATLMEFIQVMTNA